MMNNAGTTIFYGFIFIMKYFRALPNKKKRILFLDFCRRTVILLRLIYTKHEVIDCCYRHNLDLINLNSTHFRQKCYILERIYQQHWQLPSFKTYHCYENIKKAVTDRKKLDFFLVNMCSHHFHKVHIHLEYARG